VIILGDLFNVKAIEFMTQLKGRKTLVMGNHDQKKPEAYLAVGIERLLGSYEIADGILTHIPIHPNQLSRWKWNGHGHMHKEEVRLESGAIDPRYINLCVEHWNYTPAKLSSVLKRLKERGL
jgi:calcineurin-like phosphoesterase family protein